MRNIALSLGRKAAAAGMAGASVTASQPTAQARELVQQAPEHRAAHSTPRKLVPDEDGWILEGFDQEVYVLQPYTAAEVNAAVEQLATSVQSRMKPAGNDSSLPEASGSTAAKTTLRGSVVIEELSGSPAGAPGSPAASRASTETSLGLEADGVIEEPVHGSQHAGAPGQLLVFGSGPDGERMRDLLKISSKLLSRPGLQREVFKCMLEDEEVRDLMLKQSPNLDHYLAAVGIHTPGLLPAPLASESDASAGGAPSGGQKDVLGAILDAMQVCIDKTGSVLAGLGGWLRDRVGELATSLGTLFGAAPPPPTTKTSTRTNFTAMEGPEQGAGAHEGPARARGTGDVVLGAVMVVTVALLCVLMAGRPALVARSVMVGAAAASMQQRTRRA